MKKNTTARISKVRHHAKTGISIAVIVLCGLNPAWAVVDAPVREAMEAIAAKQAQKAFDALSPLEATRAGDPDYDTVLGIAANETGQFARAIFALERVLAVQPGNARARAELARAMFAVGDTANARKLLEETKAEGVPDAVGRTIDEFLQAIDNVDSAGRSSLKAHVETGLGYDSNVNSGPSVNSFVVPLFGGVFNLQPGGIKAAAGFWHVGAGVSGRGVLAPRWSFLGSANASIRKYGNNASAFNIDQIDANAGLSYREERHEFSGIINFGHTTLKGDPLISVTGGTLRQISGITGEWTYRPDGTRQWGTYLQLSNLNYPSQQVRNARRNVLGTSYAVITKSGSVYYAGGYIGRESPHNALFPHLGHRMLGVRAGMQVPLTARWSMYASASLEDRKFGGQEPFFLVTRSDTQIDLALGAAWKITDHWRITPQLAWNRTKSNIVVNDNSKTSASVMARYEF